MTEQDASDPDRTGDDPADAGADDDGTGDSGRTDGPGAESATGEGEAETEAGSGADASGADPGDREAPLDDVDVEDVAADATDGDAATEFDVEVDAELVDRVAESDPEPIAAELAALRARVDGLESELADREDELDEVTESLKRKQADFQNYKKRMDKRREQERQRATEDLVERLVDVRDNLVRALDQDEADAEDLRGGVESTLRQFDRVLDDENVDVVEPEPGEEVDPHTHEVLMRVESDQPEDAVADVHRPGYVMADKVLQTAQVTVSNGSGDGDGPDGDGTDGDEPAGE